MLLEKTAQIQPQNDPFTLTNWELYMVGLLLNYKAKRLFSQLGRLKLLYTPKITVLYWHLWFHDFLTSMETINRTVHKNVFKVEKLSLD